MLHLDTESINNSKAPLLLYFFLLPLVLFIQSVLGPTTKKKIWEKLWISTSHNMTLECNKLHILSPATNFPRWQWCAIRKVFMGKTSAMNCLISGSRTSQYLLMQRCETSGLENLGWLWTPCTESLHCFDVLSCLCETWERKQTKTEQIASFNFYTSVCLWRNFYGWVLSIRVFSSNRHYGQIVSLSWWTLSCHMISFNQ